MNFVSKIKENLFSIFQVILIVLLIALAIVFVGVLFFDCVEDYVSCLIGLTAKNNILTFLGIGMGGILVALQALASHRRAKAMEDAANEQANSAKAQARAAEEQARANKNTEQGLRQERLKNAIEHLGHKKESMRWGGAYELFHLAKDSKELRQTALDLLCLHIRQTTGEKEYKKKHKSKPSEEVQSMLTLLFVKDHEVFKNCDINLQGSWLKRANLHKARLQRANLFQVQLQGANLIEARLQEADLIKAQLQGAMLKNAYLQGAVLSWARLQGANLEDAQLQGADLIKAQLQGAMLMSAYLQGVDLRGAQLQGANLFQVQLQGAGLHGAHLQGASTGNWSPIKPFEDRIWEQIGSQTHLPHVIFTGGLTKKDVDSLVEGLSDENATELRERLKPHIDKPISHELPKDSGAITGVYKKKKAKKWIAEYKEAMPEDPEDDS